MLDENDTTTPTTSSDAETGPAELDAAPDQLSPDDPAPGSEAPESPAAGNEASEPLAASEAPATPTTDEVPSASAGELPAVRKTARKATRKVGARTTTKTAKPADEPPHPVAEQVAEQGAELSAAQNAEVSGGDAAQAATAPEAVTGDEAADSGEPAATKKTARKSATKKTTAKRATAKKATTKRSTSKKAAAAPDGGAGAEVTSPLDSDTAPDAPGDVTRDAAVPSDDLPSGDLPGPGVEADTDTPLDALTGLGADHDLTTSPVPDSVDRAAAGGETAPERDAPRRPPAATSPLFQAPDPVAAPKRTRRRVGSSPAAAEPTTPATADDARDLADREGAAPVDDPDQIAASDETSPGRDADTGTDTSTEASTEADDSEDSRDSDDEQGGNRRRRRRGGRRRRRGAGSDGDAEDSEDTRAAEDETGKDDAAGGDAKDDSDADEAGKDAPSGGRQGGRSGRSGQKGGRTAAAAKDSGPEEQDDSESQDEGTGSRRRRRRRRTGEEADAGTDEPGTVVRVRKPRTAEDEITSLHGSTRLEAKKQRRREGREAGRRRAPIVSEAEFLARREAVDRVMVIRQRQDLTQIAVLEDKVLVEHYVARESQTSLIGNVYLGRVQNVLPSMEAAFIDIGKGRNAVLYAGEVNWDSLGAGNGPRKIEQVLKSGQPILVQVSKDPIGHKGARLTSQISLPGRFLVYVPDGTTSGISRKLPDTERSRLKALLKAIVPDTAGVIVRTAAEGASEEELTLDVERLTARWSDIESKVAKGNAPQLLYGEPDLTLKVVRDLFTEDFAKLVISGDEAWDLVNSYVEHVAPDLAERLERYSGEEDIFGAYRVDEQIAKGLDRKVWLPSGGSLVIDRTEAMTVVDVNTGKFTGSGGNLEETVTKNNLEAAEEMVRQLRLRDIGGIIVIDFIDMVLESNRDLVLRRLVECLGRDRTRHQVAEVTSLGLVQMTRKRIGTGLVESFSENCEHCQGRGVVIHHEPVEPRRQPDEEPRRGRRGRGRGEGDDTGTGNGRGGGRAPSPVVAKASPSPKDIAAIAKHEPRPVAEVSEVAEVPEVATVGSVDLPVTDVPLGAVPDELVPEETTPTGQPQAEEPTVSGPATEERATEPSAEEPTAGEPATSEPATSEPPATPVRPDGSSTEATAPLLPVADGVPAADEADPLPPAPEPVPAGPRLVTSTRRRVARRPAGPPSGGTAVVVDASAHDGTGHETEHGTRHGTEHGTENGTGGGEDDSALVDAGRAQSEQAHVPVKRKGRR